VYLFIALSNRKGISIDLYKVYSTRWKTLLLPKQKQKQNLFSLLSNIGSLVTSSIPFRFIRDILSPLVWFILEKNLLYPGRICTYEADKSLRTVTSSRLRLYKGLLSCKSWFLVCLLQRYRLQVTAILRTDKFTWYPSCLCSLIFNWCFYLYDDYYLEIILMTNYTTHYVLIEIFLIAIYNYKTEQSTRIWFFLKIKPWAIMILCPLS